MADAVLVNSVQNTLVDTIQEFYKSPPADGGTLITAFTASNNTGANASYKAYIFDATGTTLPAVVPLTIVVRNKDSLGSAIVNQFIPPGGTLRMESSRATSIVFRVSGKEIT
jgi:hypothetical protein